MLTLAALQRAGLSNIRINHENNKTCVRILLRAQGEARSHTNQASGSQKLRHRRMTTTLRGNQFSPSIIQ